jgi:hypothetical protein
MNIVLRNMKQTNPLSGRSVFSQRINLPIYSHPPLVDHRPQDALLNQFYDLCVAFPTLACFADHGLLQAREVGHGLGFDAAVLAVAGRVIVMQIV